MSAALYDDLDEAKPAAERASLFSWFKKLRSRASQPKAGSPEAAPFAQDDFLNHRKEPTFAEGLKTGIGFGEPQPFAQAASILEGLKTDLLSSIARIWHQPTVDPVAFERVKNFKIEPPSDNIPGTMTLVNDEDDAIYFGIHPVNGMHAVMSASNISARHALDQVYVALTDDLMRAEGIDDVDGTDLDKALLCLAAEKNGLKINNMPLLSDDVKAEALRLWQETFPDQALVTPAPVATPAEQTIKVDDADILSAVADETGSPLKKRRDDIIDAEFTEVKPPAPVGALESPTLALAQEEEQAPAIEAPPSVIILGYTPDISADVAPETTAEANEATTSITLKPEVLDILRGHTADESVDPTIFTSFVADLKDGQFSDHQGMLSEEAIRAAFTRPVGDATEADVILKAAAAQGVVYATTKTVQTLRMVVNPHIANSASSIAHAPHNKATVAAADTVVEELLPEQEEDVAMTSDKILEQAHIPSKTYEAVKSFVAQREGDIIRPRDLVKAFAATAGVGTAKAHALMAALEADEIITATPDNNHRVVDKSQKQSLRM